MVSIRQLLAVVLELLSLRGNIGIFSRTESLSKLVVESGLRCLF